MAARSGRIEVQGPLPSGLAGGDVVEIRHTSSCDKLCPGPLGSDLPRPIIHGRGGAEGGGAADGGGQGRGGGGGGGGRGRVVGGGVEAAQASPLGHHRRGRIRGSLGGLLSRVVLFSLAPAPALLPLAATSALLSLPALAPALALLSSPAPTPALVFFLVFVFLFISVSVLPSIFLLFPHARRRQVRARQLFRQEERRQLRGSEVLGALALSGSRERLRGNGARVADLQRLVRGAEQGGGPRLELLQRKLCDLGRGVGHISPT
mmetsp:Transcript_38087/g.122442  ORF Transcript_38087/g.122442 Transcript_38087/m.122442 type:complete len:263 (+) Transcript_38087:419-1207(+)